MKEPCSLPEDGDEGGFEKVFFYCPLEKTVPCIGIVCEGLFLEGNYPKG